jgi:AcrR family transcriptional regulator
MASQISGPKYRSRTPGIPFYKGKKYVTRLEITPKITSQENFRARYELLHAQAVDNFIMHYYPELWPGVNDALDAVNPAASYQDLYIALRSSIEDAVILRGFYQPTAPPIQGRSFIVATYDPKHSVDVIRKQLKRASFDGGTPFPTTQNSEGNSIRLGLPSIDPVIAYYNSIQELGGITGESSESTFIVGSMMEDQDIVNNGLRAFALQMMAFPGGINSSLDMPFLQQDVQQFLNLFIRTLVNQFSTQQETHAFDEADTLTIFFGKYQDSSQIAISRMEYLVVDESPSPQTLAVGYLTNMSYNPSFRDKLTLSMLSNYEDTLEGMKNMSPGLPGQPMMMDGEQFSFYTFASGLQEDGVDLGATSENWEEFKFITPIVNAAAEEIVDGYAKAAIEAGLPFDTKQLTEGIEVALTSKEIRDLREKILNNPELAQKVFAEQKAKTLKAGINVSKKLGKILESGPMGFVKKNSPLDQVFRQFGIQEVAKEAFRCATFGLAPELARINSAVQKALTNQAGSIYLPPPQQPAASISKPDIDLEMFKPFSITGDIWKQILKSLIDGLRNAVLEVMKELANLLHELCDFNNPFAEDYGAQDITDFLPPEPDIYGPNSALQGLADRLGVPRPTIYQYLADLSSILSSMEICFLFTDPSQVTEELLQRIVTFNLTYDDAYISTVLTNNNAIMAFFASLATIVDITNLCDEIANALYDLNQDDICLTEADLASALESQNIESLLDLMENGLQLELPPINFECPDKAGFIENPLFSRAVPQALNMTTDIVETLFINSSQAALSVLTEPSVKGGPSTSGATLKALSEIDGVEGVKSETTADASAKATKMLEKMGGKFTEFSGHIAAAFAEGEVCSDALGEKAEQILAVTDTLIGIFTSGEFLEAMQNIQDSFDNITDTIAAASASNQTPRVTYNFPSAYKAGFNNYLPAEGPIWAPRSEAFLGLFGGTGEITQDRVVAGKFLAHTADDNSINLSSFDVNETSTPAGAWYQAPAGMNVTVISDPAYDSYEDLDLRFTFNTVGKTDLLQLSFPRFDTATSTTMSGSEVSFAYVTLSSSAATPYLPDLVQFRITSSVLDILSSHFVPALGPHDPGPAQSGERLQTNPYVNRFTAPVMDNLRPLLHNMSSNQAATVREEIETQLFPSMFAGLTKAMFNYIEKNGIFDIATLRSLQLFKDNTSCPPDQAADLLDAGGILEQVKAEFLESACFDEMPLDIKIRYATMIALFYNLIQVEIAELIVKNIFVFSAFDVEELMTKPTIGQFIASQVRNDVLTKLQHQPRVRRAIIEYYNFKIARPSVASLGGLLNSAGAVVFPIGTVFSSLNWPELVEYLVQARIDASKMPVSNVVRMARQDSSFRKTFDEAFVQDILGFGTRLSQVSQPTGFEQQLVTRTIGAPLAYGTMLIERVVTWSGLEGDNIPSILEPTQEIGGELELKEFQKSFLPVDTNNTLTKPIAGAVDLTDMAWHVRFTDLRVKYRLVYYLPTQVATVAEHFTGPAVENYTSKLTGRMWRLDTSYAVGSSPTAGDINNILANQIETTFQYQEPHGGPVDANVQYGMGPDGQEIIRVKIVDFDDPDTVHDLGSYTALLSEISTTRHDFESLRTKLTSARFSESARQTSQSRIARRAEAKNIASDSTYKKIFSETFNQEFITMVPVYQNLYLTNRYFGKIETVFDSTKNFIIQAFIDVVTGKDPTAPVGNNRPAAAAAIQNSPGPDFAAKFEGLGRDFILKMLIETPIMILKGLAEMIDPHVAIWKMVRNVTGMGFDEIIKMIDASGVLQTIDEELEAADPPLPAMNMRGEDLIALMLCLLDFGMNQTLEADIRDMGPAAQHALSNEEIKNNILPRMSVEGIDFTSTLSGMLMIPPLPFGILYILLDLLKKDLAAALTSDADEVSEEESLPEC